MCILQCLPLGSASLDDELIDATIAPLDPADTHPERRASVASWLQIQATLGLAPDRAIGLLRRWRDPRTVLARCGRPRALSERQLAGSISALRRLEARILPILSPAYPAPLRSLVDAAPVLLATGQGMRDPELFSRPRVAIVGARAPTAYGLGVARALARELAAAGVVVISGLARGIDGAAHEGALEGGGVTIAVQACGPDRIYPPQHRGLARRIEERGLLLTELPPGTPPRGAFFPLRNRLVSGLAQIVVIVEARARSGSLITARHALDQGRDVMAVPGPIDVPASVGPNGLLYAGAMPVLRAADVLEELRAPGIAGEPEATAPREPGESNPVLDALAQGAATRDQLLRALDWSASRLAVELTSLELAGRVVRDRDGRFRGVGRLRR